MTSRTRIPTAIYPIGHTVSNEEGETAGQVMMKSGDGSPISKQMIQDYPCGDETGHYFISSPLNVYSIGRSGSVVLYVEGGCPNFTWASDNAWATFSSATTSVRYNTIESTAAEGQDTVVTVTDANGLEVTINVPWNGAASCCEDPPAFSIQTIAAELGPFPGEVVVFLDGGCSPFTWTISGTGFTLDYAATNSRRNRVHNDGAASCITVAITVEDSCGQIAEVSISICVCATEDDVAYDTTNSDEMIDQGIVGTDATATIIVTDGCGPFSWEVSGTGFTLAAASTTSRTNTLIADGTACGSATITVTDTCEDSCTGYVRCTTGQWVLKSRGCVMSGDGTLDEGSPYCSACGYIWEFTYIVGNKKQTQMTVRGWGYSGYTDSNCIDTIHTTLPQDTGWTYPEDFPVDYSLCDNPGECDPYEMDQYYYTDAANWMSYFEWEC